jgi:hypothetical protein
VSDNLPSAEIKPCLDGRYGNAGGKKLSTKVMQQRQGIMADIVGATLLVDVSRALKIHVKSNSGCWNSWISLIGLALYNTLKSNIKLEKVKDIKWPNCSVDFESNIKEHI